MERNPQDSGQTTEAMMMRLFIVLFVFSIFMPFAYADTTFFEGDLGYRDDFIMTSPTATPSEPSTELNSSEEERQGGRGFTNTRTNGEAREDVICETIFLYMNENKLYGNYQLSNARKDEIVNRLAEDGWTTSREEVGRISKGYGDICLQYQLNVDFFSYLKERPFVPITAGIIILGLITTFILLLRRRQKSKKR